jgi:hypothetical protein
VVGGSNPLAPTLSPRQARATRGRFIVLSDIYGDASPCSIRGRAVIVPA